LRVIRQATLSTTGAATFGGSVVIDAAVPSSQFKQSGTGKYLTGISAVPNGGVTGSVSGDWFGRTAGGKMFWSTDDGVTADMTLDASGNLTTTGAATFGGAASATGLTATNSGLTLQTASVTKSALSVAASANQGINGTAIGDVYHWTTGGKILWSTNNGTTAHMTLDSSGNVGIAEGNPPTQVLSLYRSGSTNSLMSAGNSNTGLNGTLFGVDTAGNGIINQTQAFATIFSTSNAERMRIDASGNVGIGTSSPEATVHIQKASAGARGATLVIDNNATSTVGNESQITFLTDEGASVAGIANARIKAISTNAGDGRADLTFTTWSGSAEGERLRIDASGNLGLGVVPTTNNISKSISLVNGGSIFGYGSGTYITANSNYNGAWNTVATGADSRMLLDGNVVFSRSTSATAGSAGTVSESMRIDSSGNVGIGVVPSAWVGTTGLQLSTGCSLNGSSVNAALGANSYYDGVNYKYITSNPSTNYYSNYANNGSHVWQIAPSGTAGDTITYTHAMTLDASGNLLVGGTAAGNGGTVAVTGAVSISNSTANNQASMSKESMQQTSGVTTATTIFTSIIQGMSSAAAAQLIIYGNNNAASGFMDVVVTKGSGTPVVVSSTTVEGSPAARTYTMSGSALQLAMASGTYSVNVKCTTMGFPF
jgi:hypothetical protein